MAATYYGVKSEDDPLFFEYKIARDRLDKMNLKDGLRELENLAHSGSIMSMLFVADAMRAGWMYDKDLSGAESWYRVAEQSSSVHAVFGLGLLYLEESRFDDAVLKLTEAVDRKYPPAYNALAGVYFRGDGVLVDKNRAKLLWEEAISLGHLAAKRNLIQQQIRGQYGAVGFVIGITALLPMVVEIVNVRSADPYTDRLR